MWGGNMIGSSGAENLCLVRSTAAEGSALKYRAAKIIG
jgi:hypothetical protein